MVHGLFQGFEYVREVLATCIYAPSSGVWRKGTCIQRSIASRHLRRKFKLAKPNIRGNHPFIAANSRGCIEYAVRVLYRLNGSKALVLHAGEGSLPIRLQEVTLRRTYQLAI